ncbi:hypothetical protein ACHAWX_002643 [Stephanocyclus meneghinianus]
MLLLLLQSLQCCTKCLANASAEHICLILSNWAKIFLCQSLLPYKHFQNVPGSFLLGIVFFQCSVNHRVCTLDHTPPYSFYIGLHTNSDHLLARLICCSCMV